MSGNRRPTLKAATLQRRKGKLSPYPNYFHIDCGLCDAALQVAPDATKYTSVQEMAQEARGCGWRHTRDRGWLCARHPKPKKKRK